MELRPSDYQITGVERFPDKFLFVGNRPDRETEVAIECAMPAK